MSLLRALSLRRLPAASLPRPSHVLPRHAPRYFSTTPARANADDKTGEMMSAIRESKFFKDLQSKPEIAKVMMDTVKVLKEENFDMEKPSMMAMLTNSRIREQMKILYSAMQEAGVDMESAKETVDLLRSKMQSGDK